MCVWNVWEISLFRLRSARSNLTTWSLKIPKKKQHWRISRQTYYHNKINHNFLLPPFLSHYFSFDSREIFTDGHHKTGDSNWFACKSYILYGFNLKLLIKLTLEFYLFFSVQYVQCRDDEAIIKSTLTG